MDEYTNPNLDPARHDMAALQKGLDELALLLKLQKVLAAEHAHEIEPLLERLNQHLLSLRKSLDILAQDERQLRALFEVGQTMNSTLNRSQVLDIAMDTIIQVTRAQRGFLMLRNLVTGEMEFQVARNLDRETIASPAFEVSRSIIRRVAQAAQPIIATDAQIDPRFADQESIRMRGLRSVLCVPLLHKGFVTGVVYVDNRLRAGTFTERDKSLLTTFANQAAVAIENAQLFESVRHNMQEIAALKNLQESIFASIPAGVMALNLDDRITAFNRAAELILGVSADRLLGQPYADALPFLAATPLAAQIQGVKLKQADLAQAEVDVLHPDRGWLRLWSSVSSLIDLGGRPIGVAIVIRDETEKLSPQMEQSSRRRQRAKRGS